MKIVSFNIRCCYDGWDGINSFCHRAGKIWETIKNEKPDIIAFQEVIPEIREMLEVILPDYMLVGQGRHDEYDGEGLFTAIRKDTFDLIGLDCYWISDTPYTPLSGVPGQSPCPRICVETIVINRKTRKLYSISNVHLDYENEEVRAAEMKCLINKITDNRKKRKLEAVILGDFNALPDSESIKYALSDKSLDLTDVTKNIPISFHAFGGTEEGEEICKIDYQLVTPGLAKAFKESGIWDEERHGIYLSDHYPVWAVYED